MGNYQDYLKAVTPPLREIDATPVRLHAFGNPFKVDKRMLVDEADIDNLVGSTSASAPGASAQTAPGGRMHPRKMSISGSNAGSESAVSVRHQSPAAQLQQNRKRKPGPLPKDFRYRKRRGDSGSTITEDDRSSISGPLSPALSDISSISVDMGEISDVEAVVSEIPTTADLLSPEKMDGHSSSSLTSK